MKTDKLGRPVKIGDWVIDDNLSISYIYSETQYKYKVWRLSYHYLNGNITLRAGYLMKATSVLTINREMSSPDKTVQAMVEAVGNKLTP